MYTETVSDDAMERLLWGEVDFAIVTSSSMNPAHLENALSSGEVIQLPLFQSRFALIYSIPGFSSSDETIILDYTTMADMWMVSKKSIIVTSRPKFTILLRPH